MAERRSRAWQEGLRWAALGLAGALLVIFLAAQRQSIDVSYGQSPSAAETITEGSAGELSDATVPTVAEMKAMVTARDVVRLPGSIAAWDETRVRQAIGTTPVRILVAPPGLDEAERDRVRAVDNATVRIFGTEVTGSIYQATPTSLAGWQAQFATGNVTDLLIAIIAGIQEKPTPQDLDTVPRREPTAAEIAPIVADLRRTGLHLGAGATLTKVPAAAASAFPSGQALYVALPRAAFGEPVPSYGPALARTFPGRPIMVMYGSWIEYDGPSAADFADVAAASFYGQVGDRLSQYTYPQQNVLSAYLDRVTDVRYAGLFDRPLPYRPLDPLRVALPALPWLFAGCVLVFLGLSVRSLRRPASPAARPVGTPARLAGLTTLAVEMSALTHEPSEPGLTRGITKLMAARDALADNLPDRHVRGLLDDATAELDEAARLLPFTGYRPADYLRGRLS
jgi:hypothetical protein